MSRESWLEGELHRLSSRVAKLAEVNEALKEELVEAEPEKSISGITRSRSSMSTGSTGSEGTDVADPSEVKLEGVGSSSEGEGRDKEQKPKTKVRVRLSRSAESMDDDDDLVERGDSLDRNTSQTGLNMISMIGGNLNTVVMKGSALGLGKGFQALIYMMALAGILFVLIATAYPPGGVTAVEDHVVGAHSGNASAGAVAHGSHDHDHHRRLLSRAQTPPLMKNIAVTLTGCGLIAFTVNLLKQPLILGYLLGGVLVGPIGLGIVQSHEDVAELSSLGLIFLLFMIGLELDVQALLKMGSVVLVTGSLQFVICAGCQVGIFMGLEAAGLNFGSGPFASMYCGMACGISSTMIVAKMLGEKGEMSSTAGRLTVGILIFQDIWAIVVLAIQPNLASPKILGIAKTFGMIGVLILIALAYAKFIMPALLHHTSGNLELMLVMSLAWCFFICCTAVLPFIGLSMELASLIAGVALASFPYSAEFNGKIKYIRDFFITLFFAALGMQIPVPSIEAIAMGVLVAVVVLIFRWLGIFTMVWILGGGAELAAISTINLSQISEFALVICSIGIGFGHINSDTMTIIIWTFAILAISASYLIGYNSLIYQMGTLLINKIRGKEASDDEAADGGHGHDDNRDIVLLGFHKVAFMLVAEMKAKSPQLLSNVHVVDFNQSMMPRLRGVGISCTYGDISSPDVLEHAFHGDPKIVICSIPDTMLRGTTNLELIKVCNQVWPKAFVIVTADSPQQAKNLYTAGADYVLRMAKLCAERLHTLLSQHRQQVFHGGDLTDIFKYYKTKDKELRAARSFVSPSQQ